MLDSPSTPGMIRGMSSENDSREPEPDELQNAWDADDPRRQRDPFAPPSDPCECFCLHCHRTFMSDRIWFQKVKGGDSLEGFWMCPTANCGGAGFTFDIFPTDPNHPANNGWFDSDESGERSWEDEDDEFEDSFEDDGECEYDPAETGYKMLDEWSADDDDLDGEEWKFGLQPGQRPEPSKPAWLIEEEKKFDQPDQRPRELDWTENEKKKKDRGGGEYHGPFSEDDIPF